MYRSVHGLWRPMGAGQSWRKLRSEMVDSTILFPRWSATELAPEQARQYGTEIELVDDLPPSTIITRVTDAGDGKLLVQGVVAEDERTTQVLVNGEAARDVRAEFAEWEALIHQPSDGVITAAALDDSGNKELTPHTIRFGAAGATHR